MSRPDLWSWYEQCLKEGKVNSVKEMPLGVKALSGAWFVLGAYMVFIGIAVVMNEGTSWFLFLGILTVLAGVGLFALSNWARRTILFLSLYYLWFWVLVLRTINKSTGRPDPDSVLEFGLFALMGAISVGYLTRKKVRQGFK